MNRISLVLTLCFVAGAAEGSQLDVNNLIPSFGRVEISAGTARGQTFAMRQSGTLDTIALRIGNSSAASEDATLEVYKFDSGVLTKLGEAIRTVAVQPASEEYKFDFEGVTASAGETLAFMVHSQYSLVDVTDSDLPESEPLLMQSGGLTVGGPYEVVFATYVTPVPECSAWWLIASGIGGLISWRRR